MASVGTHIKRLRTARGLTQEELAETLFVTRQAVSAWETGKAQPDVETLERIAAALGAAVTEVIYGAPPPDLGRVKRRWALIGGGTVTIIAILLLILVKSGAWGTWREGLAYQFFSPSYSLSYEKIPGSYTLELDLKDLDSNTGKVLYEDPVGCRILVDGMDQARPGEYRVHFRSHGVYGRRGGVLVSGCQSVPVDKLTWTFDPSAAMSLTVDGRDYPCSLAGMSGLIDRDGNSFSFHLNPWTAEGGPVSLEDLETVTVTVTGLSRFSTRRIS